MPNILHVLRVDCVGPHLVHRPSRHAELWHDGSSPVESHTSTFSSTPPGSSTSTVQAWQEGEAQGIQKQNVWSMLSGSKTATIW